MGENTKPLISVVIPVFNAELYIEKCIRSIFKQSYNTIELIVINDGQIAEMKTGEGKTLVSTLAGYLNALPGNNVHIVTVNDYLAQRDSI